MKARKYCNTSHFQSDSETEPNTMIKNVNNNS